MTLRQPPPSRVPPSNATLPLPPSPSASNSWFPLSVGVPVSLSLLARCKPASRDQYYSLRAHTARLVWAPTERYHIKFRALCCEHLEELRHIAKVFSREGTPRARAILPLYLSPVTRWSLACAGFTRAVPSVFLFSGRQFYMLCPINYAFAGRAQRVAHHEKTLQSWLLRERERENGRALICALASFQLECAREWGFRCHFRNFGEKNTFCRIFHVCEAILKKSWQIKEYVFRKNPENLITRALKRVLNPRINIASVYIGIIFASTSDQRKLRMALCWRRVQRGAKLSCIVPASLINPSPSYGEGFSAFLLARVGVEEARRARPLRALLRELARVSHPRRRRDMSIDFIQPGNKRRPKKQRYRML